MAKKGEDSPLMSQYNAIKAKHPDALLLFRVGDFYETFGQDAVETSRILGIVLTKRGVGYASETNLAGFPYHALDTYLPKLVSAGKRVAICDQLEDPKLTKKIVKRGVTELVTPGVALNDQVLEARSNNFLASVHYDSSGKFGISLLDISTGEFLLSEGDQAHIEKLLQSFSPREVLFSRTNRKSFFEKFDSRFSYFMLEDWAFGYDYAIETLHKQFGVTSLKGFGVEGLRYGIPAAGAIMYYLGETQHDRLSHITRINRIHNEDYLWMDRFTSRNLELIDSANDEAVTLFDIMDRTITPMGTRLLKRWMMLPLVDAGAIRKRQDIVDWFVKNPETADTVREHLKNISDLERMAAKIATGRINPKEMNALKTSLQAVMPIKLICQMSRQDEVKALGECFEGGESLCHLIEGHLNPDAPALLSKGNAIASGVDEELDRLRKMHYSGKEYLNEITQREIERTGIPSLKISFNNVFGYYIEVRNTHKDKVPPEWIRKQTTVSAERYITEELKQFEKQILFAEERILTIEAEIYQRLVSEIARSLSQIQANARAVARIDVLCSLAQLAVDSGYCRPQMDDSFDLEIIEGRHPVIEKRMREGEAYVSNNLTLNQTSQQIVMITGPNMSGKSALLRQTALIVLMAQMGSYVPAKSARIGIVDKIFTRVGASDNISSGESTFMVEMNETAGILNNISPRSLVVLDEIGRGTSTYDGISIAWAIAEYLHEHPSRAKTLFATHYHELNEMADSFERIKNFNVSVKEIDERVIFMRKLVPGGSNHSFGIHVAQMAGMPRWVVERASEILSGLEKNHAGESFPGNGKKKKGKNKKADSGIENLQLSFFQLDDPTLMDIKEQLKEIDIDNLTPVEALLKLHDIKKRIGLK